MRSVSKRSNHELLNIVIVRDAAISLVFSFMRVATAQLIPAILGLFHWEG